MIDSELANLSNQLMLGTVLLYVVAMLGYAAELAFGGRRENAADAAETAGAALPRPEMVVAGPHTGSVGGSAGTPALGSPDDATEAAEYETPVRPQTDWARFSVLVTVLGWGCHLAELITRGMAAHRLPWGNMYEFTSAIAFAAVTVYLALLVRQNVRFIGAFLMVAVVIALGVATIWLYNDPGPLRPALNSYWIGIHVTAAIIATGTFSVAAVTSVLYLFAARREADPVARRAVETRLQPGTKVQDPGPAAGGHGGKGSGLLRRLPSADRLDVLSNRITMFGFPIWTFAIIAGAIWADQAWGRYWGWDPKETWSFITWIVYAGYLHARATAGWKGKKAAVVSLVAYGSLLFNFFGINFLVSGMHSYA